MTPPSDGMPPPSDGSVASVDIWVYVVGVVVLLLLVSVLVVVCVCTYQHCCFHRRIELVGVSVLQCILIIGDTLLHRIGYKIVCTYFHKFIAKLIALSYYTYRISSNSSRAVY